MQNQVNPALLTRRAPVRPDWTTRLGFIVFSFVTVPALLAIQAWRTSSMRYRHWLLTALVTAYGSTIIFVFDGSREGSDGVRHLWLVYTHYVGLGFEQFLVELWSTFTFRIEHPNIRDPYKHIVSYVVGGLLNAPWLFFTVIAFVYGYFFTGSLLQVFKHFKLSRANYVIIGFAALFFLTKNIEGVNTVRTWTAMWVLVYACLMYYDTKKWRYIVLMLMPPFIHFGFWIIIIPALIVLLFGNKPVLYATLFVASSFTNLIPADITAERLSATERGAHSVRVYSVSPGEGRTARDRIETVRAGQRRWYARFHSAGIHRWALNVMIYVVLAAGIYFSCMNYLQKSLFSIGLLTLTLSNSIFLFAVANRSWVLGSALILAAFVLANTDPTTRSRILRSNQPPYYRVGLHLSLFLFIPYFLYCLSVLLDYPSIFWFTAPAVVWFNPELNMSIKEFLQILLGLRR